MDKIDIEVDNFIKSKIQNFYDADRGIQPSADFVNRTMKQIRKFEKKRRFWIQVWAVVASLAPFVIRETWMLVRGDYFAVSGVPFVGRWIAAAYQLFLSPIGLYFLLFGGIIASAVYIFKFRKGYNSFAELA